MVLHRNVSSILIGCLAFLSCNLASANSLPDELTIPESYPKNYIFALFSSNQPVGPTQNELQSHLSSFGIAYQHKLSHPWVVSVGYRPQLFIHRSNQQPTSLMTFFNSTQRIYRLYHPLYLLAGTEVLYIIPVRKINPPMAKDPDFNTEIGVGGQVSLWYLMSQNSTISLDLQRWRGTKTDRLHGISLTLGLGWGF